MGDSRKRRIGGFKARVAVAAIRGDRPIKARKNWYRVYTSGQWLAL